MNTKTQVKKHKNIHTSTPPMSAHIDPIKSQFLREFFMFYNQIMQNK